MTKAQCHLLTHIRSLRNINILKKTVTQERTRTSDSCDSSSVFRSFKSLSSFVKSSTRDISCRNSTFKNRNVIYRCNSQWNFRRWHFPKLTLTFVMPSWLVWARFETCMACHMSLTGRELSPVPLNPSFSSNSCKDRDSVVSFALDVFVQCTWVFSTCFAWHKTQREIGDQKAHDPRSMRTASLPDRLLRAVQPI